MLPEAYSYAVSAGNGLSALRLLVAARLSRPQWLPSFIQLETAILFGVAVILALVLTGVLLRYHGLSVVNAQLKRARDLTAVRERERDLAQQELLRKLEEERELAKQKMQFESQLAEYEKYASLAQLALGAAHEINNPLLGILSHLELELRDAHGTRRSRHWKSSSASKAQSGSHRPCAGC